MKYLILSAFCVFQFTTASSKTYPDYLPQPCSKSSPDYNSCTFTFLQKLGPYLLKGIREFNYPKMNPLIVPEFTLNRTIEDIISYSVILKNIQHGGFESAHLESFKFDPENLNGEVRINVQHMHFNDEYIMQWNSRRYPIVWDCSGHSEGNYTNFWLTFRFVLKQVEKLGEKYYAFSDFKVRGTIETGYLKIFPNNPDDQVLADYVSNFHNNQLQRALAIVQPDFDDGLQMYYKSLAERVLDAVPAQELIPA